MRTREEVHRAIENMRKYGAGFYSQHDFNEAVVEILANLESRVVHLEEAVERRLNVDLDSL